MSNSAPRLLSEQEWRHIKREVRNLELKKFVRKKYMDDLQAERIQSHLTFEVYFFDFMTSLNSREDLQATLRSYLQDKKAELSEYTPEAKEYFLQKVPGVEDQRAKDLISQFKMLYSTQIDTFSTSDMQTDYCNNEIKLFTKLLPIGNTIIEDIIVESQLDEIEVTDFDGESSLEIYIKRLLNRIQPVTLEQRLVDITYSSRYILGALISSLGRNENIRVYEMRSMKENPGPFETSYMISFQHKDYQQKEIERYVILNFNEHINSGESEPLNVEPIAGFDTLLVHIDQNFKTNEQNPEVGHIKRTVTVHQALMSTFRDSSDFSLNPINHVPLDYLKTSQDDTKLLFHNCLMDAFQKFKHLVEDSKLPKNQNLMRYSSNFRGIVDGLFYSEPSIKNAIALSSPLSTVQYTISCGTEDIIDFRHADTSDSENELLDDDAVEVIHRDAISERLVTVNFKYTTPELYDKAYIFDGMADMIEKTNLGAAENQIANFYFVDDNVESIKSEELVVTKNKFMDLCNGARRRRSLTSCLSRKTDQPKEVKEQIPKEKIEILENLATASNSVMMLLMIRDLLSDVYHGNKLSVVKDASLLAMTAFSPQIANFLAQKGELMIANEAKIAGYASKALGFGVSRAISLYVFYDLIHNTIDYLDNTNNTSAKIGMEIDGAFLAIDAITLGIQGLETAGYVYGMAAIANPIGAIIGASMVIGLNIYQAMEKVSSINKFIHLNGQELIDESLRAFFHIDPAANVQELMSEESTNEYLMEKATEFLTRQNKYDTLITKSGVLHGKTVQLRKNAVVDMYHMRGINVSRASPKPNDRVHIICPLHEEANEIQSPTFWSKVENFFNKIAHSFTLFYHIISHKNLDVIVKDISDERSSQRGYACHNSFGIKLLNNSTENLAAYFNLGDGNDVISGFANKSNFFQLGAGKKFINGSTKSDIFIISRINISGILNGADGIDTVDFSAVDSEETFFLSDESSKINSSKLRNVENVIGRLNTTDILICDCSIKTIRLNGGWKKSPDFVVIPYRNCTYDMTIYLDGYSTLYNEAHYAKRFNILDYQISKALQDYLQNLLQPKPLIFTSIYKFIALSENNTEWFSEFKINATLDAGVN
uniref:TcdA/TcdB toxin pore forming domain-containing protein n=1 Tax=Romanomermis culicivorax TaxID=13658 RepID=A0A915L720_ROMCU